MFVIGTTSLSIMGVGPALTRDLAMDPAAAGWLVTAFAVTFAIAAPLTQFLFGRRFAPHVLILAGATILAISLLGTALATSFSTLVIARIASAMGGALIAPTSAALAISTVPDDRRAAVLAVVFAGFTIASVGGVPIATWLTLAIGWRGAMAGIAAGALLFLVLAILWLPRETAATDAQENPGPATRRLAGPAILLLGTLGMLATQFVVYALMGEFLGQQFHVSETGLPIAILLFGILGVAGNAAAGALSEQIRADRLVWFSFAGLAAFLGLMTIDLGPYLGAIVLAGCAFMGTLFATPQQSRLVARVQPQHHALALGLNSSASYLGIALGSGLASAVVARIGLSALPVTAIGMLVLTAIANVIATATNR